MTRPLITFGMSTKDDYHGCIFTIQSLRMYHREILPLLQILVVDNGDPESAMSRTLRLQMENYMQDGGGCKYVAYNDVHGTSQVRNKIFEYGDGEFIFSGDCHIMLWPTAMAQACKWVRDNPKCMDLISGPMLYDPLITSSTHWADVWRGNMHGTWGSAWVTPGGMYFGVDGQQGGPLTYHLLQMGHPQIHEIDGKPLPKLDYVQHERALMSHGYRRAIYNEAMNSYVDYDDFDIPGMGLGFFGCRKEAWLGFNEHFRGFGGEEMYIHEKFRQAGRRVRCLSFLRWWHRFARGGTPYQVILAERIRNYIIGHLELGLDLERCRYHFVEESKFPQQAWDSIAANPTQPIRIPPAAQIAAAKASAAAVSIDLTALKSVDDLFGMYKTKVRDLNEHFDTLREYASKVGHVTEISKRKESAIALAAATPARFCSYNTEGHDPAVGHLLSLLPGMRLEVKASPDIDDIEEADLLFIDSRHTADRLTTELTKFAPRVRRFIVLHDTHLHATAGEAGEPGLFHAVQRYTYQHKEWFAAYHTDTQYGLTILSRQKDLDWPAKDKFLKPQHYRLWPWQPGFGPGTQVKATIKRDLGLEASATCPCNETAVEMDKRGVAGCRATRDECAALLKKSYEAWAAEMEELREAADDKDLSEEEREKLRGTKPSNIYWKAFRSGLWKKINPLDRWGSMVDIGCDEAEAKGYE